MEYLEGGVAEVAVRGRGRRVRGGVRARGRGAGELRAARPARVQRVRRVRRHVRAELGHALPGNDESNYIIKKKSALSRAVSDR